MNINFMRTVRMAVIVASTTGLLMSGNVGSAGAVVTQPAPSRIEQLNNATQLISASSAVAEPAVTISANGSAQVGTPDGSLTVSSPVAPTSGRPAGDGLTTIFGGSSASSAIAIQPLSEGVRSAIYLDSASAPERYSFNFGGSATALELQPDGSVFILDASGKPIATVEAPWAVDAAGRAVPTHYSVDGLTLTQVISHRGGTWSYGIVADPSIFFWAKCAAALTLFVAENLTPAKAVKLGKIIKSAANFVRYLRTYKSAKAAISGLAAFIGSASGVSDVVTRCWP